MLILYNKDEKNFLSNGIGVLDKYAFDDVVAEELNGIFKLEFSYPIFAKYSDKIVADNIVRATTPDSEQPFFISRIVKKDGFLRVTAYHMFYKLIWELIEDINIVNQNGQAALDRILTGTGFTGLSDITKTASIRIVRYNVVEAIVNKGKDNTFISRFGGEIKRDKFRVEVRNHVGRYYDQFPNEIRYAKNLVSYEADIDSNNAATRIMPLAFNGLLLPEKYVAKPGTDPNNFKTIKVEYPDIKAIQDVQNPKEDEIPLEEAYEKMRQAVLSDFADGRFDAKASYRVEFQDLATTEEYKNKAVLEKLFLGDEVKVIHIDENLNILSRVISYRWSPLRKEYDEIELGNHQENFSSLKPVLESIAVKVEQYKTDWEKNIDEITLILNSALGGYVYKRAGELLIMDTEDPLTALKVWRWNLNGLGYSKVGINGPYEIAITMDGRIMASFIYVNKLSALSADLGVVIAGKMKSSNERIQIDLDNETFDFNGKVKWDGTNFILDYSGTQLEVDIEGLEGQVLNLDGDVGTLALSANELTGRMQNAEGDIGALELTATNFEISLGSVEDDVAGVKVQITPDAIIETVESAVSANGSTVLATKGEVELLDNQWTAEFKEMRTGGDNLIEKSATMEGWGVVGGAILDTVNGWVHMTANGNEQYGRFVINLETAVKYVFSVDVWTENINTPSALRFWWRKVGDTKWNDFNYDLSLNNLKWERVDLLIDLPPSGKADVEILVDCYYATTGKMWYRKPQLEAGTKGSPWKPSSNEMYSGVTKIDKDGVEVSVSNDSIKSRLAFDGLTVRDRNVVLATFGETGAVVPKLSADIINNPNVIQLRNGITVEVGSGKQYSSINAAISSLFHDGTRFLNGSVTLNIFGSISEIVDIRNLFGGALNLVFFTGAVLYGRIFITNCTTQVNILSNSMSNPSLKGVIRPPSGTGLGIEIENCSYVYVSDINMAGSSSYQAIRIMKGGVLFVINCDFAGFSDTAILAGSGSLAMMSDNVGSNLGYAGWAYQGGRVYATGKIPTSTNGIQADKGFVWLIGTTAYPSEFSPPAITAKVFTQTFTTAVFETLVHGTTNVDSYFGAAAAQNRWDSTTGWKDGRIRFGAEIFDFFNGGSSITVQIRLRRKNSTHGNSGDVLPAPCNHSASFPSGATRGGWTGWATISSSYFTSGGASLTYYNGVSGINGYAIWDAVEVWVQVTKNV